MRANGKELWYIPITLVDENKWYKHDLNIRVIKYDMNMVLRLMSFNELVYKMTFSLSGLFDE